MPLLIYLHTEWRFQQYFCSILVLDPLSFVRKLKYHATRSDKLKQVHVIVYSLTCTASLEAIGLLGNTNLYCSSLDVAGTVSSPTFFCSLQGWSVVSGIQLWYPFYSRFMWLDVNKTAFPFQNVLPQVLPYWEHWCLWWLVGCYTSSWSSSR